MHGVATKLRGVGGGREACVFDSNPRARQRTGIIDGCMERAAQELMDGEQHRLRGKDELKRLICRAEKRKSQFASIKKFESNRKDEHCVQVLYRSLLSFLLMFFSNIKKKTANTIIQESCAISTR